MGLNIIGGLVVIVLIAFGVAYVADNFRLKKPGEK